MNLNSFAQGTKPIKTVIASMLIVCSLTIAIRAAEKIVAYEGLITAAPLPAGYHMLRKVVKDGDREIGTKLIVSKEGSVAKAVVSIEKRDLSTPARQVAALKGYINGTAGTFKNAGLRLTKKEIPDVAAIDTTKPVTVKLV